MADHIFKKFTATIGAWNLCTFEHLSSERIQKQAEGLQMLDAEFITLVEIKDEEHISTLAQHLTNWGVPYNYTLVEQAQPDGGGRPMHIGALYKEGVEVGNTALLEGSDLDDNNKRKAFLCDVKIGNFDFKLIAVHLKSGRGSNEQRTRNEQCKVIGDYIQELRGEANRDPDVILMGDFNMIPGQDISNFHYLGGDDIMDFVSSWDLQERFSHILPSGRENLLDGFAISRRYHTEYLRGSLRLFPMHWNMEIGQAKYREEVSDHLPFVASFAISHDRD